MILILLSKMIACPAILFGYYWLFLRNKRFHHYNRFYLLVATCSSVVFPFIKVPVSLESQTATAQLLTKSIGVISVSRWEDEFTEPAAPGLYTSWLTVADVLLMFYIVIVFVLLYMLLRSLTYLYRLSIKYPFEHINTFKFYHTTEPGTPFSFFKSIFWNSGLDVNSREGQQIFRHELFHVKQKHSADIIFLELICIFTWINPFFHLIKKEIKAIHEFLADQHAVDDNNQHAYAELLILQSLSLKKSSISNYFFQNHIKRRIAMITHKTKKYSYWSRLLVLPLGIFLFCAFALYAQNGGASVKERKINLSISHQGAESIKVLVDAGHGGNDAGVRNHGLQEKDLSLAIARQIKQHAPSYNVDVVMTREEDVYPTLKERSALADAVKADVIVSIHVGSAEAENTKRGFDIYITSKNQETLEHSKLLGHNIADQIKNLYEVGPIRQRKENGIWILDAVHCPAVLIECGYITNEADIAFITNTKNQEQVAKQILDGIVRYKNAQDIKIIDTIPGKKKAKDSMNTQLNKIDAEKERRIAQDKLIQSQRREAENARRKVMQAQIEVQKKQRELELKNEKISREKMAELQRREQDLAKKQKEIEARQRQQMKMQENALMAKQKRLEANQRLLEEKIEKQSLDIERKTEELEIKKQLAQQRHLEEIQKRQLILLEKQQELEMKRLEMKEAEIRKIEAMNQEKIEIQKQKELKEQATQEKQLKDSEMPKEKNPGGKPAKPAPAKKPSIKSER